MLHIALIGAGFIGGAHAEAYQHIKQAVLTAVVDANEKSGREIAEKYHASYYKTADEMFEQEQIDVVDVCLPTFLHEEFVLRAIKNKKHVICEKPITLTMESLDRMIEAAKEAEVKFMVAQVIRFWPEYEKIKEMIDRKELGEVKLVYANRIAQHPNWTNWHRLPENSGGGLYDLHLHDIDVLINLFGEVDSVYAVGSKSQTGCYNYVTTSLKFKNGVAAVAEGIFEMTENYPFTMSMRVVGSEKAAEYIMKAGFNLEDVAGSNRNLVLFANGKTPEKLAVDEVDAYQKELQYFIDGVENKHDLSICSIDSSKYVLETILAIKQSLETGEAVKM